MTKEKIYLQPQTIREALELSGIHNGNCKYVAGGTDIFVNRYQGNDNSFYLIDITEIDELKKVDIENDYLSIGALVKLKHLKNYDIIRNEFPVLIEAADSVGTPVIRASATIGGNVLCENRCIYYNQSEWWRESIGYCLKCEGDICIATGGDKACFSEFVSDTAPALISMNAQIKIIDSAEEKIIPLESIYTGDGIYPVSLPKTAIIKSILLPLGKGFRSVFKKLRHRESLDFTALTTCASVDKNNQMKIAIGGVDPKPIVLHPSEQVKIEEIITDSLKKSRSVDNDMFSRVYRRNMMKVFLEDSYKQLTKDE